MGWDTGTLSVDGASEGSFRITSEPDFSALQEVTP
jgi:hypothetical protein